MTMTLARLALHNHNGDHDPVSGRSLVIGALC